MDNSRFKKNSTPPNQKIGHYFCVALFLVENHQRHLDCLFPFNCLQLDSCLVFTSLSSLKTKSKRYTVLMIANVEQLLKSGFSQHVFVGMYKYNIVERHRFSCHLFGFA